MKPPPFRYHVVQTVPEAVELLQQHGWEAKLLAGGQSLVPAMNFRLAQPAVLIDLNRVTELDSLSRTEDGAVCIGSMTRQAKLERDPLITQQVPLLAAALPHVAHPQIRNRGTIGGSLAHADPAAELPAVMLALAARFEAQGPDGPRTFEAEEFFYGLMATALAPEEVLTEIRIPAPEPDRRFAFEEIARRHGDYALAGVAVSLRVDETGACRDPRIALFAVAEAPTLARTAMLCLEGQPATDNVIAEAAAQAAQEVDPPGDLHASGTFRRHLVGVLVRRALARALGEGLAA